jgi:AcrR family transcriptional regulator
MDDVVNKPRITHVKRNVRPIATNSLDRDAILTTKHTAKKASPRAATKAKPVPAAVPMRRPQAQRSADTQSKLIAAAITCLHRMGYSATTVTMVADEAKVSRGAMSHQYPAKMDLMLAVVEAVYEADSQHYRQSLATKSSKQWLRELPAIMWDVISQPSGTAVMEIMLASRSDKELADKLRTKQGAIDVRAHEWVIERLAAAGLRDRPDGEAVHRLFVAAVRGLSLEALFRRNRADIERSVAVLEEILGLLYPAIDDKPSKRSK